MTRIALTGGIASGKSEASKMFADLGALIIDSDVLAREVVEPGTPAIEQIRARFGDSVMDANGGLDRLKLGQIVFADEAARLELEAIVHPAIRRRAEELVAAAEPGRVIINVIPLLVEKQMQDDFDLVIVVDVPREVQLARLMANRGHSEAEATARLSAQASREERLAVADIVIDNSGSRSALKARVRRVWRQLQP